MIPAATPPTPNETIIKPSCDTVEYARIRFMSVCATAMSAANNAVIAPIQVTAWSANDTRVDTGCEDASGLPSAAA